MAPCCLALLYYLLAFPHFNNFVQLYLFRRNSNAASGIIQRKIHCFSCKSSPLGADSGSTLVVALGCFHCYLGVTVICLFYCNITVVFSTKIKTHFILSKLALFLCSAG